MKRFSAVLLTLLMLGPALSRAESALEEYVYDPDPAYSFAPVAQWQGPGFTAHFLHMTSQRWRKPQDVTPNLWTHRLTVIVPDIRLTTTAHLIISGGSTTGNPPDPTDLQAVAPIALATGAVVAAIEQVPSQPLVFAGQPGGVREDDLVSYSWAKMMETGDPTWAAYLPMTKASVRAMDATQEYLGPLGLEVTDFIVTGFSKRGAAAWLTAAVDPRVRAVVPGVFNVLHIADQAERLYGAYGGYGAANAPYVENRVLQRLRSPEGRALTSLVDPISYADKLNMPQLILQASGDEFFLPDASRFFMGDFSGPVVQRIVPNDNHGLDNHFDQAVLGLVSWYQSVLSDTPLPQISDWVAHDGVLEVATSLPAAQALLWQATNPQGRDFRQDVVGDLWQPTPLLPDADGVYRVRLDEPATGYTASMVEFTYAGVAGIPQTYTSGVYVVPDALPFALHEPIARPRPAAFWADQVRRALRGNPGEFDHERLKAFLPMRVHGQYIRTLDDLDSALAWRWGADAMSRRQCTAVRLNVEAAHLGWYSTVRLHNGDELLWTAYARAEAAADKGDHRHATMTCLGLNFQR